MVPSIPYHFSIIRYIHNIGAGEFINIGIAMLLPSQAHLMVKLSSDHNRASRFFYNLHIPGYLLLIQDLRDRFNAVLKIDRNFEEILCSAIPPDSDCFSYSEVMCGITDDPDKRFDELYCQFVGRHKEK